MEEEAWNKEIVPRVLQLVSQRQRLGLRDLCTLLLLSPSCYHALLSHHHLWEVLDLHEMNNAGERLLAALSLPRYQHVKYLNLEFAQDIEDKHVMQLKGKSLMDLRSLNLNGCQKISDDGIEAVTAACPNIRIFSIYWNVRVTYVSVKHLVNNCKEITELNLSGCKILLYCPMIMSLNLYALSSLTDNAYQMISFLTNLRFLDLCGAQNLSDQGLSSIAKCKNLVSLNLTWCVNVTDVGVLALASTCTSLEYLSLFGITGVTDKSLEALSRSCSATLSTLDVNGCIGIKRRNRNELLELFPKLRCFKVHS
ncbi:F-box protein At3g58530 isoform X3 [Amborella trichopoda]|uniref:F-box protein At3g58530 isoform X3 n=1 Tax=Amborella trichopoda TaxID=13333 RepID=UPI0005D3A558|nr:F-box protein At3g58530 isoform X3 [Amborella trichopoda]|eukprot:XP_011622780.1 F-box protein At3g58530 isoform X3 [Amborella trichopoda]